MTLLKSGPGGIEDRSYVAFSPAKLHGEVAAFDPAKLSEAFPERVGAPNGGGSRSRTDEAYAHDLLGGIGSPRGRSKEQHDGSKYEIDRDG
jgi:hypothetical protein